jgi:glycosyltransferase involved in cell wall biosynthesis
MHNNKGGSEALAWALDGYWRDTGTANSSVLTLGSLGLGRAPRLTVLRGLRREIARRDPDGVLLHGSLASLYGRAVAFSLSPRTRWIPVLHAATDHYLDPRLRLAEPVLLRRTTRIVAVSEAKAAEYLARYPRAPVQVIPNGVHVERYRRLGDFPATPTRFLATSRIDPQKDIATMIAGFAGFAAARPANHLLIAGAPSDPAYAARMRRLLSDGRVKGVSLLGPRSDVPELLGRADVFVHTAVREAHPISVLEAAVAGVPIVAADLPANRAIVGDRAAFFPPGQPEALRAALESVADGYPEAVERARELAGQARRRFAIPTVAASYLRVIADGATT